MCTLQNIFLKKGKRSACAAMKAVTGFPDKHKKYFILSLILHVASVVDFPGFIFTLPERNGYSYAKGFFILEINVKNKIYQNIFRL